MGLQFNPLAAAATSALAAAISGYKRAPRGTPWWSAAIVLSGWAVGDGIRLAGASQLPAYVAAWAVVGLLFGYVAPAVLGAYVGRRVHLGTGWLAAAAVALMLAPALSVLGGALSTALWKVAL